jgi:hypothetical protein
MVKVTLRTMLATIQNRQPLPAQPLRPPPNTIMPDSSPERLCSSRPLVLLTDCDSCCSSGTGYIPAATRHKRQMRAFTSSHELSLTQLLLATMVHRFFDFFEVVRDLLEGPRLVLQGLHLVLVTLVV